MGFAYSRNIALKKSSGNWIVIIDHDDLCLPNRLEIHYEQILSDKKNCKLFFGDTIHFGENINLETRHLEKFDMNKMSVYKDDDKQVKVISGKMIHLINKRFEELWKVL